MRLRARGAVLEPRLLTACKCKQRKDVGAAEARTGNRLQHTNCIIYCIKDQCYLHGLCTRHESWITHRRQETPQALYFWRQQADKMTANIWADIVSDHGNDSQGRSPPKEAMHVTETVLFNREIVMSPRRQQHNFGTTGDAPSFSRFATSL